MQEYEQAKLRELELIGNNAMSSTLLSSDAIVSKVKAYVSKHLSSAVAAETGAEDDNGTKDSDDDAEMREVASGTNNTPTRSYAGVVNRGPMKYQSYLRTAKNWIHLGYYVLESDAALAHDHAAKLLKIPKKANFRTSDEHEQAKVLELARADVSADDVMSSAMIVAKATEFVSKHHSSAKQCKRSKPENNRRTSKPERKRHKSDGRKKQKSEKG